MKKRYDYFWARIVTQITGIVFLSQLVLDLSGMIQRKPGLEWVVPACGVAFVVALIWSVALIVLNSRNSA